MATGFKKATVNASSVPATQTNFPSYVDLSRIGIATLAEAQSVRVYADSGKTTEWAREIVSATEMHVKVPSLTSTVDMYVDWDGTSADYAATDTYGRNAVWSDYVSVYHMSNTDDSKAGTNNLTNTNSVAFNTGKIGLAADTGTSNTTKRLSVNVDFYGLNANSFTSSLWVNMNTLPSGGTYHSILQVFNAVGSNFHRASIVYQGTNGFGLEYTSATTTFSGSTITTGVWAYIVFTWNTSTVRLLRNASQIASASAAIGTQFGSVSDRSTFFGVDTTANLGALIDESRIRLSVLSDNWITTEYNNQSDEATFWGTWTTVGGGATFVSKTSWLI